VCWSLYIHFLLAIYIWSRLWMQYSLYPTLLLSFVGLLSSCFDGTFVRGKLDLPYRIFHHFWWSLLSKDAQELDYSLLECSLVRMSLLCSDLFVYVEIPSTPPILIRALDVKSIIWKNMLRVPHRQEIWPRLC